MRILVCVKQVRDPDGPIRIDASGQGIEDLLDTDKYFHAEVIVLLRPLKNGFAVAQNLFFAACEPFFTGYAKHSFYLNIRSMASRYWRKSSRLL